jgi:hypothetical protein
LRAIFFFNSCIGDTNYMPVNMYDISLFFPPFAHSLSLFFVSAHFRGGLLKKQTPIRRLLVSF